MWHLQLGSVLFHIVHLVLIFFSITAWAFESTREWHLGVQLSIIVSWYIFGLAKNPGYCLLTDYHFRLLRRMGHKPPDICYVKFILDKVTMLDLPNHRVNQAIEGIFFICTGLSLALFLGWL